MELNPAALLRCLREEPAAEQAPQELSPYLLEHVLAPYLRGEEVVIGDIDYSAFSSQEMCGFLDYVQQLGDKNEKTERLWKALGQRKPLVIRTPSFC